VEPQLFLEFPLYLVPAQQGPESHPHNAEPSLSCHAVTSKPSHHPDHQTDRI
jgi:hypothetical protein